MTEQQVEDTVHGPLVPETDRDAAPVVGLDVEPEELRMPDGSPFPAPNTSVEAR